MEEEAAVMPLPPVVVVDEEGVVHPLPPVVVVVEEEEVVQPPPVEEEEEVGVQPPPLVEEEGVQPPPLVEEGVQPALLMEEEGQLPAPGPHALLQAQWVAALMLGRAAHYRHLVDTGVEAVIARCRTARVTLREVAQVLLHEEEAMEAAETIYTDLVEAVSRGMNPLLIAPAANIVDSLFNWPGPLPGPADAARALVHATFYYPGPEGGPLLGARRELQYIVDVVHHEAGHHFVLYVWTLGFDALPGGLAVYNLWVASHHRADVLARVALERLDIAVEWSLLADLSVRLCGIMPASRVRPGAGPLVPTAVLRLQQTVGAIDDVLEVLLDMQDNLLQGEQIVVNLTGGQDPPAP